MGSSFYNVSFHLKVLKTMSSIRANLSLLRDSLTAIFSKSDYHLLRKTDILLICHDVDKSYTWEGKAYSPLMDSLKQKIEGLGLNTLSLVMPISRLSRSDAARNALEINRQYVGFKIFERLFGGLFGFDEFNFWEKIIRETTPRCVIAVQPPPALSAAGKTNSVKVFDLQHGIIESSVYYNTGLARKYGIAGYPDGVLVWDRPSEEALKNCLGRIRAITVGNAWLQRFQYPTESDRLVSEAEARVKELLADESPTILISLQCNKESIKEIVIPDYVSKALSQLLGKGWTIWVRFHPIQIKKLSTAELRANWQDATGLSYINPRVLDVSEYALPALLKFVTAHLTAHSAASIEADFMGVPTLLWRNDECVRDWFSHYVKYGRIEILTGHISEIVSWATQSFEKVKNKSQEFTAENPAQLNLGFLEQEF